MTCSAFSAEWQQQVPYSVTPQGEAGARWGRPCPHRGISAAIFCPLPHGPVTFHSWAACSKPSPRNSSVQSHLVYRVVPSPRGNTACITHFSHLSWSPVSIVLSCLISLPANPVQLWPSSGWHKAVLLKRAGGAEEHSPSCGSFPGLCKALPGAPSGCFAPTAEHLRLSTIQGRQKTNTVVCMSSPDTSPSQQRAQHDHPQRRLRLPVVPGACSTHGFPWQCPAIPSWECHRPSQPGCRTAVAAALLVTPGSIFLRDNLSP